MNKLSKSITIFAIAAVIAGTAYSPICTINASAESTSVLASASEKTESIEIKTAKELMNMKSDGVYHLANDIDLSGVKWRSISGFSGTFDGNGYEIKNLKSSTYGLFSTLKSNAVVKNVKLTNVEIMSKFKTVGAVAALIKSGSENVEIDNCFVSGVVASCRTKYKKSSKGSTAGAIVGKNNSKSSVISNCYSNAVVCAEYRVGGIVGTNKGTVKNSGFGGALENSSNVEQLAVDANGEMTDEYSYTYCSGGICATNYGSIENCLSDYTDKACGMYNGGIVGRTLSNSKIINSVNLTKIWPSDDTCVGLIAGYASKKAIITNCYTREPDISMTSDNFGKTVGKFEVKTIAEDKFGSEELVDALGEEWTTENEKVAPASIKDYVQLECIATISGGKLNYKAN